jgi:hypothetical protein
MGLKSIYENKQFSPPQAKAPSLISGNLAISFYFFHHSSEMGYTIISR